MHKLTILTKYDEDFRRTKLYCLTETWLTEDIKEIDLEGCSLIWYDWDTAQTAKSIRGGLCLFVNSSWATNITVHETVCSTHYWILTVSCRPRYLHRKFGQTTLILVYVLGPDFKLAAECIAASCNNALRRSAGDLVFLLGDFNKCDVSKFLPDFEQYVTFNTRLNKFLDQCFANLKDAYVSRSRPSLGRSDQNIIHLFRNYWQLLKRTKPTVQLCQVWTEEVVEELKGCTQSPVISIISRTTWPPCMDIFLFNRWTN